MDSHDFRDLKKQKTKCNEVGVASIKLIMIEQEIRETYEKLHNLQEERYKLLDDKSHNYRSLFF
jgi:hypothetical protein